MAALALQHPIDPGAIWIRDAGYFDRRHIRAIGSGTCDQNADSDYPFHRSVGLDFATAAALLDAPAAFAALTSSAVKGFVFAPPPAVKLPVT